jgi:hypothetical protein
VRVRADILERALPPPGRLTFQIVRRNHTFKLADDGAKAALAPPRPAKVTSEMARKAVQARWAKHRVAKNNRKSANFHPNFVASPTR